MAGDTFASVSGRATTLFSHTGGIQAIAGNGPLSLQAHTDALEILADQAITVTSAEASIEIAAQQKIILQAGQSSVTLDGSDITFACPGTFSVKGVVHGFESGARNAPDLNKLPDTRVKLFDEAFVLHDPNGVPLSSMPYRVDSQAGKEVAMTEAAGVTSRVGTEASEDVKFALLWHSVVPKKS